MAEPTLRRTVVASPLVDSPEALRAEVDALWRSMESVACGYREVLHAAPPYISLGQLVYADGSDWNPGSGAGTYAYEGTSTASAAWTKL